MQIRGAFWEGAATLCLKKLAPTLQWRLASSLAPKYPTSPSLPSTTATASNQHDIYLYAQLILHLCTVSANGSSVSETQCRIVLRHPGVGRYASVRCARCRGVLHTARSVHCSSVQIWQAEHLEGDEVGDPVVCVATHALGSRRLRSDCVSVSDVCGHISGSVFAFGWVFVSVVAPLSVCFCLLSLCLCMCAPIILCCTVITSMRVPGIPLSLP